MAKITLITLYDDHSTGVRIMSNVLREHGHESNIIFFKISMNRVIPYDKEKPLESIILHDGKLMTWCPSGDPWTQKEIDLLIRKIEQQSPQIIGISYRSIFDNDIASLRELFERHPAQIACVVMEAETFVEPVDGFLQKVKDLCHEHGALLVFDEMLTGFRWHLGGAQSYHGVTPDLSCFGKALANGFSLAALAGRRSDIQAFGQEAQRPIIEG